MDASGYLLLTLGFAFGVVFVLGAAAAVSWLEQGAPHEEP